MYDTIVIRASHMYISQIPGPASKTYKCRFLTILIHLKYLQYECQFNFCVFKISNHNMRVFRKKLALRYLIIIIKISFCADAFPLISLNHLFYRMAKYSKLRKRIAIKLGGKSLKTFNRNSWKRKKPS